MDKPVIGNVVKIESKYKKSIEDSLEICDIAHVAFVESSRMLKEARESLWELIEKIYPHLNDFNCSINKKNFELKILGHKNKP